MDENLSSKKHWKKTLQSQMKLIALLLLLISPIANADPIVKTNGEILIVLSILHFYGSYDELYEALPDEERDYVGITFCERNLDKGVAMCDVHLVEPQEIDGEHTTTLGHEVGHGIWGDYHPEPRVKRCQHCVGKR
jgi:hypothetical protein